jgi:hypothetical protein
MPQELLPLYPSAGEGYITDLLTFEKRDGTIYYFHGSFPIFSHAEIDRKSLRLFTSQLVVNGTCWQIDLIKAFGVSPISVKRAVKKHREGGGGSLLQETPSAKFACVDPRCITESARVSQRRTESIGSREPIGGQRGYAVSGDSRRTPGGAGKKNAMAGSAKSERSLEDSQSAMGMRCTRVVERVCAAVGLIEVLRLNVKPSAWVWIFYPSNH